MKNTAKRMIPTELHQNFILFSTVSGLTEIRRRLSAMSKAAMNFGSEK